MAGLNWLWEHSLPRENEDKPEKNTADRQQQRQLLCGFSPSGCVQRLRPGLNHKRTQPPFHLVQELQ